MMKIKSDLKNYGANVKGTRTGRQERLSWIKSTKF